MDARKVSIAVLLCASLAVVGTTGASAQTADPERLCVAVSGTAPEDGWDVLSLSVAIASGSATITSVGSAVDCAPGQVTEGPQAEEPGAEAPEAEANAITPGTPSDTPLPIEVVDAALIMAGDNPEYVVILGNPNPSGWLTSNMPVRVDLLDGDGALVNTYSEYITLLPGQTGAIINGAYDAEGAAGIEVVVANGENDWAQIDYLPGELTFSQVKTKKTDYGPKTTGRIASTFDEQLESVRIAVVYRDGAGNLLGGDFTYLDFIPAAGESSFKVEGYGDVGSNIKQTEVYYGGFVPSTYE